MILVEAGETVVQKHRGLQVGGYIEPNVAPFAGGGGRFRGGLELPLGRCVRGGRVGGAQLVRVFWDVGEFSARVLTARVFQRYLANLEGTVRPDDEHGL